MKYNQTRFFDFVAKCKFQPDLYTLRKHLLGETENWLVTSCKQICAVKIAKNCIKTLFIPFQPFQVLHALWFVVFPYAEERQKVAFHSLTTICFCFFITMFLLWFKFFPTPPPVAILLHHFLSKPQTTHHSSIYSH